MPKNYFPRSTVQIAEELMRSVESENKENSLANTKKQLPLP